MLLTSFVYNISDYQAYRVRGFKETLNGENLSWRQKRILQIIQLA